MGAADRGLGARAEPGRRIEQVTSLHAGMERKSSLIEEACFGSWQGGSGGEMMSVLLLNKRSDQNTITFPSIIQQRHTRNSWLPRSLHVQAGGRQLEPGTDSGHSTTAGFAELFGVTK